MPCGGFLIHGYEVLSGLKAMLSLENLPVLMGCQPNEALEKIGKMALVGKAAGHGRLDGEGSLFQEYLDVYKRQGSTHDFPVRRPCEKIQVTGNHPPGTGVL